MGSEAQAGLTIENSTDNPYTQKHKQTLKETLNERKRPTEGERAGTDTQNHSDTPEISSFSKILINFVFIFNVIDVGGAMSHRLTVCTLRDVCRV